MKLIFKTFRDHKGIPGHHGGSLPRNSSLQLRENWKAYRREISEILSIVKPYIQIGGVGDTLEAVQIFRNYIEKTIGILDGLSQDELCDLVDYWQDPTFNKEVNAITLEQQQKNRSGEAWDIELAICRLDEEHCRRLFKKHAAILENLDPEVYSRLDAKSPYSDLGKGGLYADYHEWYVAHEDSRKLEDERRDKYLGSHLILDSLFEYGATNEFRKEVLAEHRRLENKFKIPSVEVDVSTHKDYRFPELYSNASMNDKGSMEDNISRIVDSWTTNSGAIGNPWVHAAVLKAFADINTTECYWSISHLGMIYRDPDPAMVDAAKEIYRRTQEYHKNKRVITPTTFYRGVVGKVTTQSPLSATSSEEKSISNFGNTAMVFEDVPVEKIFMSYKSLKGIWPPEGNLIGKKEFVLLSDMLVPGGTK